LDLSFKIINRAADKESGYETLMNLGIKIGFWIGSYIYDFCTRTVFCSRELDTETIRMNNILE
jgi:hypothetical protein